MVKVRREFQDGWQLVSTPRAHQTAPQGEQLKPQSHGLRDAGHVIMGLLRGLSHTEPWIQLSCGDSSLL